MDDNIGPDPMPDQPESQDISLLLSLRSRAFQGEL